jgi:hypothetical protein
MSTSLFEREALAEQLGEPLVQIRQRKGGPAKGGLSASR